MTAQPLNFGDEEPCSGQPKVVLARFEDADRLVRHAEQLVGFYARIDKGPQRRALDQRSVMEAVAGPAFGRGEGAVGGFELTGLPKSEPEIDKDRAPMLWVGLIQQSGRPLKERAGSGKVVPPECAAPGRSQQTAGTTRERGQFFVGLA